MVVGLERGRGDFGTEVEENDGERERRDFGGFCRWWDKGSWERVGRFT